MDRLRPCPFCGGEAKVKPFKSGIFSAPVYYVLCTCCRSQTAVQLEESEVVEAWNMSAPPPVNVIEVVFCKDCEKSGMYAFGCGDAEELACLEVEENGFVRFATAVDPYGYCNHGKRRKKDGD